MNKGKCVLLTASIVLAIALIGCNSAYNKRGEAYFSEGESL